MKDNKDRIFMIDKTYTYRHDIDGLRAFAVLSVVIFHAFPTILNGGFIGVDVFFVISGYLICGIILRDLHQGTFSIANFYCRRIRRIFPSLITVMLSALVFGWFSLYPDEYKMLAKHVMGGATFVSNFVLWSEVGYFDTVAKTKPLLHLWSLGIEEQFYIFFPIILYCCVKNHVRTAFTIIFLGIVSFFDNMYLFQIDRTADFYSPLSRFWELLAGASLAALQRQESYRRCFLAIDKFCGKVVYATTQNNDGHSFSFVLALLGSFLLVLGLLLVREVNWYPGWRALMPVMGTVFLIAAGPANFINNMIFGNRLSVFIGKISYPLYLWHWLFISFAFIMNGGLDASTRWIRIALVGISFLLSVLTYYCVERPIRFGQRWQHAKVLFLICVMVLLGLSACCIYYFPALQGELGKTKYNTIEYDYIKTEEDGRKYTNTSPEELTYCRYVNVGAKETVAIIGDSHAECGTWEGVATLGKELHFNTLMLGWIIPGGDKWAPNEPSLKNIPKIMQILKEKKDIKKVFISVRGMLYITGIHNYTENIHQNEVQSALSNAVGLGYYKLSLQNYVNELNGIGKKVYIIAEYPELPNDIRNFVVRPLMPSMKKFPPVYKKDVLERQKPYLEMLSTISNATVIYTIEKFCPNGMCIVYNNEGFPLYTDDDHLSPLGGDFLAQEILRPYLTQ